MCSDGDSDLLIVEKLTSKVAMCENVGTGSFSFRKFVTSLSGSSVSWILPGEINNDLFLDFVAPLTDSTASVFINQQNLNFILKSNISDGTTLSLNKLALSDVSSLIFALCKAPDSISV